MLASRASERRRRPQPNAARISPNGPRLFEFRSAKGTCVWGSFFRRRKEGGRGDAAGAPRGSVRGRVAARIASEDGSRRRRGRAARIVRGRVAARIASEGARHPTPHESAETASARAARALSPRGFAPPDEPRRRRGCRADISPWGRVTADAREPLTRILSEETRAANWTKRREKAKLFRTRPCCESHVRSRSTHASNLAFLAACHSFKNAAAFFTTSIAIRRSSSRAIRSKTSFRVRGFARITGATFSSNNCSCRFISSASTCVEIKGSAGRHSHQPKRKRRRPPSRDHVCDDDDALLDGGRRPILKRTRRRITAVPLGTSRLPSRSPPLLGSSSVSGAARP